MAVRGLDRFLGFFEGWESSFAVIGGCACSQWFSEEAVRFRSTQDIDDATKHRNDVFQLVYIFRGRYEGDLPDSVRADLMRFLNMILREHYGVI